MNYKIKNVCFIFGIVLLIAALPCRLQAQEDDAAEQDEPAERNEPAKQEPVKNESSSQAEAPVMSIEVADVTEDGKISLDLKGVDIIELLKILSKKMNVNVVPTKEVTGRVNVFLNDVTFEDALDIVMISNGLAAVKDGEIIMIMPVANYTTTFGKDYNEPRKVKTISLKIATPKDVFNVLDQLKTNVGKVIVDEASGTVILVDIPEALALMERAAKVLDQPKLTEIFDLKYAKVDELKEKLANVFTAGTSSVEVDSRTNKMAVSDLPEKMEVIREMVTAFDEETRQVLIDAQIVQVALSDQLEHGIEWDRMIGYAPFGDMDLSGAFPVTLASEGKFTLGTMDTSAFAMVFNFLKSYGKTEIISRPRIAVVDQEEASILVGTKEVYFSQTQSQSQVTTTTAEAVNFVDVGVKLNVTPTITKDDYIIMNIRPEVSTVREYETSPLGSTVPVVETSQAETVVKVKDGAMILIGGLMKEEQRLTEKGYPWLGDIPLLGWLFKSSDRETLKTEIAIFITPHIHY